MNETGQQPLTETREWYKQKLSATEAECAGLKTLLAQKQCEACGGLLTPSADLVAECAKLREGNEAMCRTMAKMAQLQITVEMQRDAAAARVAELAKGLLEMTDASHDLIGDISSANINMKLERHARAITAARALLTAPTTEGKA